MSIRRFNLRINREKALYGLKWIALASLVGIAVGVVIVTFDLLLGGLIALVGTLNVWIIVCLPVVGLFSSGLITHFFAPEARGHGTDNIIKAYRQNWGMVRGRTSVAKMSASIVTIGFGGSAGPEGPAVQIGGGISSVIGQTLHLSLKDRKMILACGMSAGFGSIFMAPLSGALFSCEVVYRDEFEYVNLLPCAISSVVGFLAFKNIMSLFKNVTPLIQIPTINYTFYWTDIFVFLGIGLLCGLIGLTFIRIFYFIDTRLGDWKKPDWIKTTIGGITLTLLVLLLIPLATYFTSDSNNALLILGLGWPLINIIGLNPVLFSLQFLVFLLLFKILATSLTLGSGGSGGIVAPSIAIGGLVGSIIAALFAPLLTSNMQQAIIVVSSIVLFASIAHVPLTGMLMGGELYGINFIVPTLLAGVVGSWIITSDSIYRSTLVPKEVRVEPLNDARNLKEKEK
ncbi:MAG: chloride channel protein [Candidatus Helarchaeota archaeon]|nr:chloride channel protein [Candidatus Helarchaeota archaeon]